MSQEVNGFHSGDPNGVPEESVFFMQSDLQSQPSAMQKQEQIHSPYRSFQHPPSTTSTRLYSSAVVQSEPGALRKVGGATVVATKKVGGATVGATKKGLSLLKRGALFLKNQAYMVCQRVKQNKVQDQQPFVSGFSRPGQQQYQQRTVEAEPVQMHKQVFQPNVYATDEENVVSKMLREIQVDYYLCQDSAAVQALGDHITVSTATSKKASQIMMNGRATTQVRATFNVKGSRAAGVARVNATPEGILALVVECNTLIINVQLPASASNAAGGYSMSAPHTQQTPLGRNPTTIADIIDVDYGYN